jgi:hypothetical protein
MLPIENRRQRPGSESRLGPRTARSETAPGTDRQQATRAAHGTPQGEPAVLNRLAQGVPLSGRNLLTSWPAQQSALTALRQPGAAAAGL